MSFLKQVCALLLFLSSSAFAGIFGNTSAQEIGDVVFRDIDLLPSRHSAIYVGQTNKSGNPTTEPFFHSVIEMTGIVKSYLFFASKVEHIRLVNFGEFQRAHPEYYGAFQQSGVYDLNTRKAILKTADELRLQRPAIEYVVEPWESTSKLLYVYFKLKETETLENYGSATTIAEKIGKIARMRSDAFVEFCYAAAGVPIARDMVGAPLDLTTGYGAATLVLLAVNSKLFPDNQREWMVPSEAIKPDLLAKDSVGNLVSEVTSVSTVTFVMSDAASGPGLLKLYLRPADSVGEG